MSLHVVSRRLALNVTAAALLAAVGSMVHAQGTPVNNPPVAPRSILVFPQRDFVSSSGFGIGDLVTVEVFHPGSATPASTATNVVPQDDPATPGFDGIVEVNHPGGACWEKVTPDIGPGDRVRTTRKDNLGTVLGIDETTVANVTAKRPSQVAPDTIEVHGTAQTAAGAPIDITQLEQRLVVPRDAFDLNGRRTLRATSAGGADGVLQYDGPGSKNWTARYTGLSAADVTRAVNAESRILWLGSNPAAVVENTIYEVGAGIVGGPAAPCTAPLETVPPPPGSDAVAPSTPTNVTATVTSSHPSTVSLTWAPSTDNVGVTNYGVYRNGVAIGNVENPDGSAPAPTGFNDVNVPPGTWTYTVDAADAVGNRSAKAATFPAQVTTDRDVAATLPPCGATPDGSCVSDPPAATPTQVQIIAFPARDFTSSSGYTEQDSTVTVQVIRNGYLISTANVIPQDDPTTIGFDGIVEVNHPGGGCWMGTTPDLRAGDIVRQIAYAADGMTVRRVDQTHVANISVERPRIVHSATPGLNDGVVEVHGTAMAADGSPLPAANITQRLVANRDAFDFNGRRTLRAGGAGKDGELVYDTVNNPAGIKFTATYSGLDENDVYRAVGGTAPTSGITFPGAESRILWLADPTVVAPGMTIYENSDLTISGPAAGACTAPLEPLDTSAPSTPAPTATTQAGSNSVQLTWAPSTDDTYVNGYGIYRRDDGVAGADFVRIRNVGATLPAGATTFSFVDANVPPGNHTYAVDAVDSASPLKVNYPNAFAGPNTSDPILQGVEWGNRSPLGVAAPVTQGDVLAPTVPTNLVGRSSSPSSVTLTWTASTDDVGVTSYRVYRNGIAVADVTGAPPAAAFTDAVPMATTPTTYTYAVDAADAAGNRSAQSTAVSVIVTAQADTTAPSQPATFAADTRDLYTSATAPAIGPHDVKLSWPAATDNVGVIGYAVYRRTAVSIDAAATFTKIADLNGTTLTFTDANIPAGTYDYAVDSVDSAGNRSAKTVALDVVTVDDPPKGTHSIIPFPQRDFVSSTGYALSEGPVVISVIRGGKVWARSTPITPVEDPATPGLGAVEVNHPGGGCWDPANGGITPDVRPGDIVRFTNKAGKADQTTVANVWADRATDRRIDGTLLPAGTIQTHGTAQDAAGKPLALDAVESRLVSSSANPFSVNGRRVLRAGGAGTDGTLAYDAVGPDNPNGTKWTATFTGLSLADVDLAKGAESRAVWLGRDPLALTELTIVENGDGVVGGPAAGVCTAPAEAGPAVAFGAPAPFAASFDPGALTLAFPSQGTGTSATQTLALTNVGTADATRAITGTLSVASAGLEFPNAFSITSNTCSGATLAVGDTCSLAVTFAPTATGAASARLLVTDNANNSPVQVIAIGGDAFDAQAPAVTAPVQTFAPGAPINAASVSVIVTSTATDASGVASMTLEQSTDGGRTWSAVSPAPTVDTSKSPARITATLTVSLSGTYQYRATATDAAGNKSAPVASSPIRMTLTDDSSGTPKFSGSWSSDKNSPQDAGTIGSTLHWASAPSAGKTNTVTFTFTGTEVALVSSLGSDRGQVSLSVDGGALQMIDLFAPGALQKAMIVGTVSGLTSGTHTLTVNVLSTKNPSSLGTRVDVDAFVTK